MGLGAAPLFQVQLEAGDFHSEELERLLAAASTADLAREVVKLLEPHGQYYSQYLWKADRHWAEQQHQMCMGVSVLGSSKTDLWVIEGRIHLFGIHLDTETCNRMAV